MKTISSTSTRFLFRILTIVFGTLLTAGTMGCPGFRLGGDGTMPPPTPPTPNCVQSGGRQIVRTVRLSCPLGSLPRTDNQCLYFINTIGPGGTSGVRYLNVSPAFFRVNEGYSIDVPLTLQSAGEPTSGFPVPVTVQATFQNCRSFPCSPVSLMYVNVSPNAC